MAVRCAELLLVEDNPSDVRLTREALKTSQMPVHLNVARDGIEALELLRKQTTRPDLILLDLNLPKKSGKDVLAEIKADPELRRIPVLVMTTSKADQDVDRAYSLNANCYIAKPMDLDEFQRIVQSIEDFWLKTVTLPSKTTYAPARALHPTRQ